MPELRLSQLCQVLSSNGFPARVEGEDRVVRAVNTLENAQPGELSFLSNVKYLSAIKTTKASALILKDDVPLPEGMAAVRCADPYAGVTVAIIAIHGYRKHPKWGVSPSACIHDTAKVGANANIAAHATIAANVVIGDNCNIYPGCYVGDGAVLGNDCTLFPNVVVYDGSLIGNRVTVHAGSVIGEDGLGYAPHGDKWVKIPQIGRAVIGDDVEIGANCAIDRATLGETRVGSGTKFGNVIVVGHGTKIGVNGMFIGLVGIAGSVTIGDHVTLAGQVGVAGHLTIGDHVMAGAQSGIAGSIPADTRVLGVPASPVEDARRSMIAVQKLPDWIKRVKQLESELQKLKAQINAQSANQG